MALCKVLLVGGLQVLVDVLALDEKQRQAVYKADDVHPAAVEITAHPQFSHTKKMVVLRVVEIKYPHALPDPLSFVIAKGHLDPILEQSVFLSVGDQKRLHRDGGGNLPHGVVISRIRQPWIQFTKLLPQIADENHFTV